MVILIRREYNVYDRLHIIKRDKRLTKLTLAKRIRSGNEKYENIVNQTSLVRFFII